MLQPRKKKVGAAGEKKQRLITPKSPPPTKKRVVTYDPLPKEEHQRKVRTLLTLLGMTVPAGMLATLLWKTANDQLREMAGQIIDESGVSATVDWVTHPEDSESGVCDYCQSLEDNGPYNAYLIPDSHPNCCCTVEPHID